MTTLLRVGSIAGACLLLGLVIYKVLLLLDRIEDR